MEDVCCSSGYEQLALTEIVEQIKSNISDPSCNKASIYKLLLTLKENLQKEEKVNGLPDIISFLLGPVIQVLPLQDLNNSLFQPFIPIVKLHLSDTLSDIHLLLESSFPENSLIPKLKKSLEICVQLLNDVDSLLDFILGLSHITTSHVFHLPKDIAHVVLQVLMHCKKSKEEYKHVFETVRKELMCLFQKCHKVQINLFKLLNEKITFNCVREKETTLLVEVLCVLQEMAEVVGELDTMSLVAHWKGFALLIKTYSPHLTSRLDVSCSINCLAGNIKQQLSSLDLLISGEKKAIMKLVKVTSLQLKVLIKLCEQFRCHLGDSHAELLNCLITLSIHSSQYLSERGVPGDVAAQVTTLLSAGSAPLLSHLLHDPNFHKEFLRYADRLSTTSLECQLGYCNLINLLLRKLIQLFPKEQHIKDVWIDQSHTIITTVFIILEHCSVDGELIFSTEKDLYQLMFIHTAAFIAVTFNEDHFHEVEQILMKNILQPHLWPALFSSDLMCIIARLGTSELCLQMTQLLYQILWSWPSCDRVRPEFMFVSWTLGRLVSLLSSDHQKSFLSDLPSTSELVSDVSSLLTQAVSSDTIVLLHSLIDRFAAMGDLTVFPENSRLVLSQPLLQLWQFMVASNEEESRKSSHWILVFYSLLITATSALTESYNNVQIGNVLDVLLKISYRSSSLFSFGACEFLRSLAPKTLLSDSSQYLVCERISLLFSQLMLAECPLSKQLALETFAFFAYVTKYEQVVAETVATHHRLQHDISSFLEGNPTVNSDTTLDNFLKSLMSRFEHKCKIHLESYNCEDKNGESNPHKKLKVSHEKLEHSLHRLEENMELNPENELKASLDELGNSLQRIEQNMEQSCNKQLEMSHNELLEHALRMIEENVAIVDNYLNSNALNKSYLTRIENVQEILGNILKPS